METINVKVVNKVASVIGSPAIICGNSDYNISIDFDTEWETLDVKTARFVYTKDGKLQYIDVTFSGTQVSAPILSGIDEVYLGVYASNLHTTTPARIICKRSILCTDPDQHEEPDPDVYQQLMDVINNLETLPTVSKAEAGKALMVNENGSWVVRQPDFMLDQNTYNHVRFFFGTDKEWETWTGDKTNVLFVSIDDDTLIKLNKTIGVLERNNESFMSGSLVVGKARTAEMMNGVVITSEDGAVKVAAGDEPVYVTLEDSLLSAPTAGYSYIYIYSSDVSLNHGDLLRYGNDDFGRVEKEELGGETSYKLLVHTDGKMAELVGKKGTLYRMKAFNIAPKRIFESANGEEINGISWVFTHTESLFGKHLRFFFKVEDKEISSLQVVDAVITENTKHGRVYTTPTYILGEVVIVDIGAYCDDDGKTLVMSSYTRAHGEAQSVAWPLYLYAVDLITDTID